MLLTQYNSHYVLPAVFSDDALEMFFGQARQRSGGNFYIDTVDITAAAQTKNLHALLKYDVISLQSHYLPCTSNINFDDDFDITMAETECLLQSNDIIKDKIIYLAGYLEHKFGANIGASFETEGEDNDPINSQFLTNLNRGGLSVPLISTVHFVYSAYKLVNKYNFHCCRTHLSQALAHISSPMVEVEGACVTLSKIFLKAFVLDKNDKERQLGCLRRSEKLSNF